ncbi:MAG: DUF6748 domain-containing protein [Marinagarivorans sp.]
MQHIHTLGRFFTLALSILASFSLDTQASAAPLLTKDYPVYSLQKDLRRCAAPGCGGWWVTLVNGSSQSLLSERPLTAEAPSATPAPEYVASLDFACVGWSPESITRFTSLAEGHSLLVAGKLLQPRPADTNAALLQYGALQVSDGFYSATASAAKEPVYSLTSTGIVCAVAPCPSFQLQAINSRTSQELHALEFADTLTPEQIQRAQSLIATSGLLVSGSQQAFKGPAGTGTSLRIGQIFWPYPAVQPD